MKFSSHTRDFLTRLWRDRGYSILHFISHLSSFLLTYVAVLVKNKLVYGYWDGVTADTALDNDHNTIKFTCLIKCFPVAYLQSCSGDNDNFTFFLIHISRFK